MPTLALVSTPDHPLTDCSLNHATWLASMLLPISDEAIELRASIEAAITTGDLQKVEAAMTQPMLEWQPKRKRGAVVAMWRGWRNRWLAMNEELIWSEVRQSEQVQVAA